MQAVDVEARQPWEVRLYKNAFKRGASSSKSTLLEDINTRTRSGESLGKLLGEIKLLLGEGDNDENRVNKHFPKELHTMTKTSDTVAGATWELLRSCFDSRVTV